MTDPVERKSETPYALEVDGNEKKDVESGENKADLFLKEEEEAGFYVCKNWFARKNFDVFPQRPYKPVFLKEVNDGLWNEFTSEVYHYMDYYTRYKWYYMIVTILPTVWFLVMVLPDLLYYYEIVSHGVGILCGVVLAVAFYLNEWLQRRLMRKKVNPMFAAVIQSYKPRFILYGYTVAYEAQPTLMDGVTSYIVFRRAPGSAHDENDFKPKELGFYMDEDLLGRFPYAKGVPSPMHPPRFLQGLDPATWKTFAQEIDIRMSTPRDYLLKFTIGMGLIVGAFVFGLVYCVIVLSRVRHWLLIALFPIYGLVELMKSFRRRHYVENILIQDMQDLLKEYEAKFSAAGFGATFELEYIFHYLCLNTYVKFYKAVAPPSPRSSGVSSPVQISTTATGSKELLH